MVKNTGVSFLRSEKDKAALSTDEAAFLIKIFLSSNVGSVPSLPQPAFLFFSHR